MADDQLPRDAAPEWSADFTDPASQPQSSSALTRMPHLPGLHSQSRLKRWTALAYYGLLVLIEIDAEKIGRAIGRMSRLTENIAAAEVELNRLRRAHDL